MAVAINFDHNNAAQALQDISRQVKNFSLEFWGYRHFLIQFAQNRQNTSIRLRASSQLKMSC